MAEELDSRVAPNNEKQLLHEHLAEQDAGAEHVQAEEDRAQRHYRGAQLPGELPDGYGAQARPKTGRGKTIGIRKPLQPHAESDVERRRFGLQIHFESG